MMLMLMRDDVDVVCALCVYSLFALPSLQTTAESVHQLSQFTIERGHILMMALSVPSHHKSQ